MTEPRIDPETLAALLDGRLKGERREAALAALASDEAAYEAYADAVAVTRELEAEEGRERAEEDEAVRPIQSARSAHARSAQAWWGRYGTRRLLVAAGIVGLLVLPWALYRTQSPETGPLWVVQTLNGSAAGIPAGWDPAPWGARRSALGRLTEEARSARVGARIVHLELAVRTADSEIISTAARDIAGLLDSLPAAGPAAGVYRQIAERAGAPAHELEPLLARGRAAAVQLLDEDRVTMGAWSEAARIAATREDASFFADADSRAMLERLRSDAELPDAVRAAADRASAAAGATPTQWDSLTISLTDLLAALGRS